MPYECELSTGQRIYLDCQGNQTIVTLSSSQPGQQQQSSCGFQTGAWTAPPQLFQTPGGAMIKITTAQAESLLQIQGNYMGISSDLSAIGGSQSLPMRQVASPSTTPMPPMPPMQPMKMGDMQMTMNPMTMQMGNMGMQMGSPTPVPHTQERRFCSQCGGRVDPSDRFCSSCGHQF
ncbi:zinc ribbon domain-containing protein [Pantanalinema sp. GBBB05]|uniref:zinc ribbon domain-containing protein n=1 Tax=Pantanalinema sp. GBBB05 TaxID=2604139 RepID=UPI001D53FB19|nr:zinc ribbon domain-containing protein [Pantanalinema sp. GBBB05]